MRYARTSFLIAVHVLALGQAVRAQPSGSPAADPEPALAAIRPQAIRAHMRFLADDLLEGRRTATRGYDLAARYVAAHFEALGLEPAGTRGSYFQPVPLVEMTTVEPECSLTLLRDGRKTVLRYGEDFFTGAVPGETNVTAPVVFVGFGVTAPELGYDDYAGIDVKGKIVIRLSGAPPAFPPDQRAYYSDLDVKNGNAAARGAVGVFGISTPEREKIMPWEQMKRRAKWPAMAWADEAGRPHNARGTGALLSRKGAEALFVGAPHSLEEVFQNAKTGRPLSFEMPVEASMHLVGRSRPLESPNVAAVLPGSDPRLKDEYVVLSAHLDHVGVGEPVAGDSISDRIYNGAFDNATGIAILLEMAQALARLPKPPQRSILFLALTGEEEALKGSEYFAHHPTLPIDRMVANVNLDMVLTLYPLRDVVAFGAEHSSLGLFVNEAARQLGLEVSPDPFPEQVRFIRTDHYSFVKKGVPAISLAVGLQTSDPALDPAALYVKWIRETYHQPQDDMSQAIDFGALTQFTRLNLLISYLVAQSDKAPSWNPGDFFGDKFRRSHVNP
ncbi:MAG TPA: M28 family metallopeptidase [Thermoanaerobaculia bacterium]|nr:M28 family metallopeptidase [Thermoanaerobaculia bacterium]